MRCKIIENIESLKSPPIVGQTYLVPCVFGHYSYLGKVKDMDQWWPILRPSHEDSKYVEQTRTIWKKNIEVEEMYYEADPTMSHHYHIDPRFAPASMYTRDEQERQDWHNTVTIESAVEWQELKCVRDMPTQVLYESLGKQFVEDHKDKKLKCMRCPHKGMILSSIPDIDGIITCPGHGLKFDSKTNQCITGDDDVTQQ